MNKEKVLNFLEQCEVIAKNSPDAQTKVGAMAVHPETYDAILPSYNGFISGAPDHKLPKTRPGKHKYIIHAEMNMICQAARKGRSLDGYSCFCTLSPCIDCCRVLWQAGIRTIYFKEKYYDFDENQQLGDMEFDLTNQGKYYKLDLIDYKSATRL